MADHWLMVFVQVKEVIFALDGTVNNINQPSLINSFLVFVEYCACLL